MTQFEYHGGEEPPFEIIEAHSSETIWHVDREKRGNPAPRDFDSIGTAEVKVVVTMQELEGEAKEKAEEAHQAITDLKEAMIRQRELNPEEQQEMRMGNLHALPEVEREIK